MEINFVVVKDGPANHTGKRSGTSVRSSVLYFISNTSDLCKK